MAKSKTLEPFDQTKLANLSEPVTVTVHKKINGRPMPLALPIKPGEETSGTGWDLDEVRQLDEVLVPLFGGGEYNLAATGANGAQMRWQSYFPVDRYPDKPITGAVVQQPSNGLGGAAAPVMVTPPSPSYMPPPGWMQTAVAASPAPAAPSVTPLQHYPFGLPQQGYSYMQRHHDEERIQQEREERLKLEAKIERERLENSYKEQLAAINQEIRRMQEQTARPAESAESIALKAELAELRKERENDKIMQMIREVQQSTQQQIAALTTLITQQANQPKGPDPMIMMLIETQKTQAAAQLEAARLQAEAQKEAARLQAEMQKEAARTALGPREMIELMSRSNQGHDQLASAYTRLLETSQATFENLLSVQGPQVHPALEMVGQGMQGVMGVAQRYIEMKEKATLNQAQAAAVAAQASAQAQVAIAAQASGAQLAAATPAVTTSVTPGDEVEEDGEDDEVEEMEKELFGGALGAVERLRKGVETGQVLPEQAASAVLQGIEYFNKKGEPIPAFALWQQNELAKLVDVLVPDALASYKEQMTGYLFEARKLVK